MRIPRAIRCVSSSLVRPGNVPVAMARRRTTCVVGLLSAIMLGAAADAQQEDATTPREAAPVDLTGYWVSVVSEDWRVRMTMGQKGDWEFMNLNADGERAAEAADPVNEDPCMAYGAAGLMRIPTRLRIGWEDGATLRIDTDAGMQTRFFEFTARPDSASQTMEPTRQGHSTASWNGRELDVVTRGMLPGYYFKHGVPYSRNATMTEHVALIPGDRGDDYLFFTAIVDDPQYLEGSYIRTLTFKREPDDSGWDPTPCTVP